MSENWEAIACSLAITVQPIVDGKATYEEWEAARSALAQMQGAVARWIRTTAQSQQTNQQETYERKASNE